MESVPLFVGLDYHASFIRVCVMGESGEVLGNFRCEDSVAALAERVGQFGVVRRAAIEACCGAADLAEQMADLGWPMAMAHPGYVNRLKQTPDKTDTTDAQLLADLTRVGYVPEVWIPPEPIRDLRTLVRDRQKLVDDRRDVKLQIRATLRERRIKEPYRPWTLAWVEWIKATDDLHGHVRWVTDQRLARLAYFTACIAAAEERLRQTSADDSLVRRLLEQPGIGLVTACAIRAEIGRFDRFRSGKQLSRFCGLSPRNASSGRREADAGLVRAGNRMLRAILIQAAHRLKRYDTHWRRMADRMRAKGKHGCVIAAAVANRWMRRLFHTMTQPELLTLTMNEE